MSLRLYPTLLWDVYPAGHCHEQHCLSCWRPCLARIPSQQCKKSTHTTLYEYTVFLSQYFIQNTFVTACIFMPVYWTFFCFINHVLFLFGQVLRYFDYVFTGVFTFEMLIKVRQYHRARKELLFQVYCEKWRSRLSHTELKLLIHAYSLTSNIWRFHL